MNDHILSTYDTELKGLRTIVVQMGDFASNQLENAMTALRQLDVEQAQKTLELDKKLDALEATAERAVIGVFARRAPVADDLREVISALKMTTMIERMGDYAKNIAKRAIPIADGSIVLMPQMLDGMSTEALKMIENVIHAYIHRDQDLAMEVWERDEHLDSMYNAAYRRILARMMENPEHISILTHYLMIAKNLERIGDQATNVAEQVYYAITGKSLDDERLKNDVTSDELYDE